MKTLRTLRFSILCLIFLNLAGIIGIVLRCLLLGKGREFARNYIVSPSCRIILFFIGVQCQYDKEKIIKIKNNIIIFNHNSFLDVFLLTAMPFKNAYPIISEGTKKFIPLYLCNLAISSYVVPLKKNNVKRHLFFMNITEEIKDKNINILTSPEGVHYFRVDIAKFNDEIFLMALNANKNITPLFIDIPPHQNPFGSFQFYATQVKIDILPEININKWDLTNYKEEKNKLRSEYIALNKEYLKGHNVKS